MKPKSKLASFFNAIFIDFRHFKIIKKIEEVVKKMNPGERVIFYISSITFLLSGIILLLQVHSSFLIEVPAFGGSFTEGVIGTPRFVNPVLAISDTDKDLSSLIYSGLLKASPESGFQEDLASSITNTDGEVYTVVIRDDAYFHDGKKVTSDDVLFTIEKALDPIIKSPRRTSWEGVTVEKVNDKEIKFILNKPYSHFLEALTIGILPKHIWGDVSSEEFPFSQFNINPIGSGPYEVKKVSRNSGGIPTGMTLLSFNKYGKERSLIKNIEFKFFQNETDLAKAYVDGSIDSASGLSPSKIKSLGNAILTDSSLPRVFGVFFNQNVANVFLNKEVRRALDIATPKKRIIDEVLSGLGKPLNGPTPENTETDPERMQGNIEEAKSILEKAGWKPNEDGILQKKTSKETLTLSFSISTSDSPELKKVAEILKESWEALGARVDIKIFESADLNQNIIRGRKYDALLFGEIIGRDSDLYPFWHSSQRNDPGLNIALYTNITVDKMLEDIRAGTDLEENKIKKETLIKEIQNDTPAIFLFSPNVSYIAPAKVKNISLKNISAQNERFVSITNWYIDTDKVWSFFRDKSDN